MMTSRGNWNENISYYGIKYNALIIVGIPYLKINDKSVELKRNYLDK